MLKVIVIVYTITLIVENLPKILDFIIPQVFMGGGVSSGYTANLISHASCMIP